MARHEQDREDLYEEFRSAVQKWEISTPGFETPIVAGIRKDGRFSLYFDQDRCYHFNASLQLMRAYAAGSLYRTQGTTLARLTRQRTEEATELIRNDLTKPELLVFLQSLEVAIQKLTDLVNQNEYEIQRSMPDDPCLIGFSACLNKLSQTRIRLAPPYPTKRR